MVWPYCSVKCTHNVLGHTPPPLPQPGTPPLENFNKLLCSQSKITFQAVLKPLSLNPNDSVATVTLENEALLFCVVIVFATL